MSKLEIDKDLWCPIVTHVQLTHASSRLTQIHGLVLRIHYKWKTMFNCKLQMAKYVLICYDCYGCEPQIPFVPAIWRTPWLKSHVFHGRYMEGHLDHFGSQAAFSPYPKSSKIWVCQQLTSNQLSQVRDGHNLRAMDYALRNPNSAVGKPSIRKKKSS